MVTIEEEISELVLVLLLRSSRSAAISRRVLWGGVSREGWERGMGDSFEVFGDAFECACARRSFRFLGGLEGAIHLFL